MADYQIQSVSSGKTLSPEEFVKLQQGSYDPNFQEGAIQDLVSKHPDKFKIVPTATTPPPSVDQIAQNYLSPVKDAVKGVAEGAGEFLGGMGTAVTGIPAMAVRLAGGDPTKIELPFDKVKQDAIGTTRRPMNLQDLAEPPRTIPGRVGNVVGELASFAVPESKIAKAAELTKEAMGGGMLARGAANLLHAGSSGVAAGAQVYGRTGDKEAGVKTAIATAALPLAVETGLGGASIITKAATGKSLRDLATGKGEDILAAIYPFKKKEVDTMPKESAKQLMNRMASTGTKLNEEGRVASQARWAGTADAMKSASADAEQSGVKINGNLFPDAMTNLSGAIAHGESNYGKIRSLYADVINGARQFLQRKAALELKASGVPVQWDEQQGAVVPTQPLTQIHQQAMARYPGLNIPAIDPNTLAFSRDLNPMEAEKLKEAINASLGESYKQRQGGVILDADQDLRERVQAAIGDAIRKEQYSKIGPVTVAGKQIPYKDAGNLARMDASLAAAADYKSRGTFFGTGEASGSSLVPSVALGELLTGHALRPSQIGFAAFKEWRPGKEALGRRMITGPIQKTRKLPIVAGTLEEEMNKPVQEEKPQAEPLKDTATGKDIKFKVVNPFTGNQF